MSNHWFTADPHMGHKFVSDLRGFTDTIDHDTKILDGILSTVHKNDILWVLGDYSVSQHRYARSMLDYVPCKKVLVPGNHDPEHPMHRQAWKYQAEALGTFEAVVPYQRLRLNKINFLMSHLPYHNSGDHTPGNRYNEYRLPDEGLPLLCGHVHDAWKFNGNQFNVGVDVNDFKPVSANTVVEWAKDMGVS